MRRLYSQELASKIEKDVCHLSTSLDVTAEVVRTQECAAGNLVADIMLKEMSCDCAIVNAGVLRANLVYLPGTLKIKDILDILPMEDIVVSVLIKGWRPALGLVVGGGGSEKTVPVHGRHSHSPPTALVLPATGGQPLTAVDP